MPPEAGREPVHLREWSRKRGCSGDEWGWGLQDTSHIHTPSGSHRAREEEFKVIPAGGPELRVPDPLFADIASASPSCPAAPHA